MFLKKIMPLKWKLYLKYMLSSANPSVLWEGAASESQKIIVALAADYGNLGDVAITNAQEEFLRAAFPNAEIIDFPISKTFTHTKSLKKMIGKDDVITIVGGGNMGDLYYDIELCRQFIIKAFPNNKIVSFPQSIFYSKERNLKRSIKVYSAHKNLCLFAREKYSYDIMKNNYKNADIRLCPDIVLSLKRGSLSTKRQGMLLIMRDDKESAITSSELEELKRYYQKNYNATSADTVVECGRLSIEQREEKLEMILSQIESYSVVVTNRLHGMIFCVVTKTPCVVLPIKGNKIIGVKEWIGNLNYITYCPSYDTQTIDKHINEISNCIPNNIDFGNHFDELHVAIGAHD